MSYKLNKPYTEKQRMDFIVQYNHNQGLKIEEGTTGLYALEAWELLEGDDVVDNKEAWEVEQAQKEAERIAKLSLTKREVFLALYKASGITPEQIKEHIKESSSLIEFEYANEYYRGNPLIDLIGNSLGFSSKDLDYLFKFKNLPPKEVIENA